MFEKNMLTAALVLSLSALLAGCGGGSSSSDPTVTTPPTTGSTPPSASISGTLDTPQYPSASAEMEMFTKMNAYRTQCGFPAVKENTVLDQAAKNHTLYMQQNGGIVTDTEVSGNAGFTGVTYNDRAITLGWPSSINVGGGSAGFYTNTTLSDAQYGAKLLQGWVSGVYHQQIIAYPVDLVGLGVTNAPFNGYPQWWGSVSLSKTATITNGGTPLTFPCQGVTGVPASGLGESPTPPNTSGNAWGTPITIMGNTTDAITLSSATITDPSNHTTNMNVLDSSNDPNNILAPFTAVAYSSTPLTTSTTYSVTLNGTYDGAPFTKTFTFTTGN